MVCAYVEKKSQALPDTQFFRKRARTIPNNTCPKNKAAALKNVKQRFGGIA